MFKQKIILFIGFVCFFTGAFGQNEEWDNLLDKELAKQQTITTGIFKSSRIINGQSVEMLPKKALDLRVAHRFAEMNTKDNNFLGFDEASTYFGLYYGINDKLNIGLARATYNQTNYGFLKYAILRQASGEKNIPLSIVFNSSVAYTSKKFSDEKRNDDLKSRFDFTYQLLLGKKINKRLSIQLTPTLVHRNLVETKDENNDIYSIGFGGRYLISKRISFNFEYYWVLNNSSRFGYSFQSPIALGFDIQLGSHVFQLMLTNVSAMTENKFIGETTSDFFDKGIRFGFNLSQIFSLNKHY